MNEQITEVIARGILFKNKEIVLCKSVAGGHYFLPGGHVEFGEKAEDALQREFVEETGEKIKVVKFVGAFENSFSDKYIHHEVNLVFLIESSSEKIICKESHIVYEYLNKEEFKNANFLPKFFKEVILKFWNDREIF